MKKVSVLAVLMGMSMLGGSVAAMADGKYGPDVTVKGTVVEAIVDDATGTAYVLEPESANEPLPAAVKSGAKVTVYGDSMEKNGHASIRVENVK
jgi:hypothetical protein